MGPHSSPLAATVCNGAERVFYLAGDRVHELSFDGRWSETDLTEKAKPPATPALPGSALAATALEGACRVFFLDADNAVHVLTSHGGYWTDTSLAATATPADVNSPLAAAVSGKDVRAFFLDAKFSPHVHCLRYDRDHAKWLDDDLTNEARKTATYDPVPVDRASSLAAVVADGHWRVFFLDVNHDVHQLWYDGRKWWDEDITNMAGQTVAPVSADAASPLAAWASLRIFFLRDPGLGYDGRGSRSHVRVLWPDRGKWKNDQLPATAAAFSALSSAVGRDRVFFLDPDHHVHNLRWDHDNRRWKDEDLTKAASEAAPVDAAPAAPTSPLAALATDRAWSVYFLDADGDVHALSQPKNHPWTEHELTHANRARRGIERDRGLFLARVSEWAYIKKPPYSASIDETLVQTLMSSEYGDGWQVKAGVFHAWPFSFPHLPYMWAWNAAIRYVVLAFQGSNTSFKDLFETADTLRDWITDFFGYPRATYPFPPSIGPGKEYVHPGFNSGWTIGRDSIWKEFQALAPAGDVTLMITGHSLGGALAKFFFADAVGQKYAGTLEGPTFGPPPRFKVSEIFCGTFSAPMIGNKAFEAAMTRLISAAQARSGVTVGGAHYEAQSELVGYPDANGIQHPGFYLILDHLGYAPGGFPVSLPIIADDFMPVSFARWGVPLCHTISTYIEYFRDTTPLPVQSRQLEDAKNIVVVFHNIYGGRNVTASINYTYREATATAPPHDVTKTLVTQPLAHPEDMCGRLTVRCRRPRDLFVPDRLSLSLERTDTGPNEPVWIPSVVIYVDGREAWRSDTLKLDQSDPGRSWPVWLSGFVT